jgi:hypothetical protein
MDSSESGEASTAAAVAVQIEVLDSSFSVEDYGGALQSEPMAGHHQFCPSTMDFADSPESSTASVVAAQFEVLGIDSSIEEHSGAS